MTNIGTIEADVKDVVGRVTVDLKLRGVRSYKLRAILATRLIALAVKIGGWKGVVMHFTSDNN